MNMNRAQKRKYKKIQTKKAVAFGNNKNKFDQVLVIEKIIKCYNFLDVVRKKDNAAHDRIFVALNKTMCFVESGSLEKRKNKELLNVLYALDKACKVVKTL